MAALWDVVSERGFAAVSVRSVAAQAGLPASTVAKAFAARADMLAHAYEGLAAMGQARRALLTRRAPSVESLADEAMVALPLTTERARQHGVWIALIDAAGHDQAAAQALASMNESIAELIRSRITRAVDAGVLRADLDVGAQVLTVHAMIDGFAAQLLGTRAPNRAAIRAAFLAHFSQLAA